MPRRPRPSYFRDPPLLVFGGRLRQLREARGWSQTELAHRAGRHWTHVSGVERGERSATLLTILGLAEALEVDAGVLLSGDEELVAGALKELEERRASDEPKTRSKPGDRLGRKTTKRK